MTTHTAEHTHRHEHTLMYTFDDTCPHTPGLSCQDLFRSSIYGYPSPIHTTTEGVCVCVCVCDRYSLPVRAATKCFDISRLCSPGSVIPSVAPPSLCPSPSFRLLHLWINASHPIMSSHPHSTSFHHLPSFLSIPGLDWQQCVPSNHLQHVGPCITRLNEMLSSNRWMQNYHLCLKVHGNQCRYCQNILLEKKSQSRPHWAWNRNLIGGPLISPAIYLSDSSTWCSYSCFSDKTQKLM